MKDYLLQTCVRLRLNYADMPFSALKDEAVARRATERVSDALMGSGDGFAYFLPDSFQYETQRRLNEKGLLHPDTKGAPHSVFYLRLDEKLSVQTALGDHAVIAAYDPKDPLTAYAAAEEVRSLLSEDQTVAKNREIGYLTAYPCHAGTGMTAHLTMHLPLLRLSRQADKANAVLLAQHDAVLRPWGGDAKIPGGMYLLENKSCIGKTPEECIAGVMQAAKILQSIEERFRCTAKEKNDEAVYDPVWRALGVGKYARKMTVADVRHLWSMLTLGVSVDAFDISEEVLDDLLELAQGKTPGDQQADPQKSDILRAQRVRFLLNGGN